MSLGRGFKVFAAFVGIACVGGCSDILGLGDYRDLCKPYGIGDPPDCVYGSSASTGSGGNGGGSSNGGSSQGGGGSPPKMQCEPGETRVCYDGPDGTAGVAACKKGTQKCPADGSDWGACEQEVLPKLEQCAQTADENCDTFDCVVSAEQLVAAPAGSGSGYEISRVIVLPKTDEMILTGFFSSSMTIGGKTLIPTGTTDGFVVHLKANGTSDWATTFQDVQVTAAAVSAMGEIFIGGGAANPVTIGTGNITPGAFVGKLDANGNGKWGKNLTAVQGGIQSLAATPGGDVIVGGSFTQGINFGDGAISGAGFYVAKLRGSDGFGSKSGTNGFWADVATQSSAVPMNVGTDSAGNVLFGGSFQSTTTFAAKSLVGNGNAQWFFGKLKSTDGSITWSEELAAAGSVRSLSVDESGNLLLGGTLGAKLTFEAVHDQIFDPMDGNMLVLAWKSGDFINWGKQYAFQYGSGTPMLLTEANGDVVIADQFTGTLNFGSDPHDGGGIGPIFISKLASTGQEKWVRTYDFSPFFQPKMAGSLESNGYLRLGVTVFSSVNFGTGPLTVDDDTAQMIFARFGL